MVNPRYTATRLRTASQNHLNNSLPHIRSEAMARQNVGHNGFALS
jgi:hypothetical protein